MVNFENKDRYDVYDLKKIVSILRAPGGCPWDAEQTHESIRRNLLEEAFEAVEAIDENDPVHLCEELGDVLMQVIFHSDIEADAGRFDLNDVADMSVRKLLNRHPHVFGDLIVSGSGEVIDNWDVIKRAEKNHETTADALDAVAKSLPGLWRAEKMQKKASKVGFDWPDITGPLDKLSEELRELMDAVGHNGDAAGELGDVLFSAVNVARFLQIDPDVALQGACDKFSRRFRHLEEAARDRGKELGALSPEEMDKLYTHVKEALEKKYE
ncbi:nucleoside triphosphate pyrophosphohydrolase [Oscillospiraceae bacterium WX1]